MDAYLRPILNELHQALQKLYGERLNRLVLFGSYARGTATPESDIDVLVVLDGEVRQGEEIRRMSEVTAPLSVSHETMIYSLPISCRDYEQKRNALLDTIRKEGIAV